MQKLRAYGARVGTHGTLDLRSKLNLQAKTSLRALAIGVMVVGALAAFNKTADASALGSGGGGVFGNGDDAGGGTYLGIFDTAVFGNNGSNPEGLQAVIDALTSVSVDATGLIEYSKINYEETGPENVDSDKGSLATDPLPTAGSPLSSGQWLFTPVGTAPLVTLLAIKADGFFGLWFYDNVVQTHQHGTYDVQELFDDINSPAYAEACGKPCVVQDPWVPGISHITVYGNLATTVIPLPAALPLFLTALAGLGGMTYRRRRKEASAAV